MRAVFGVQRDTCAASHIGNRCKRDGPIAAVCGPSLMNTYRGGKRSNCSRSSTRGAYVRCETCAGLTTCDAYSHGIRLCSFPALSSMHFRVICISKRVVVCTMARMRGRGQRTDQLFILYTGHTFRCTRRLS